MPAVKSFIVFDVEEVFSVDIAGAFVCRPLSFSLVFFSLLFSRAVKMREMIYRYENERQSAVSQLCKAGRVSQRNAAASRIPIFLLSVWTRMKPKFFDSESHEVNNT